MRKGEQVLVASRRHNRQKGGGGANGGVHVRGKIEQIAGGKIGEREYNHGEADHDQYIEELISLIHYLVN